MSISLPTPTSSRGSSPRDPLKMSPLSATRTRSLLRTIQARLLTLYNYLRSPSSSVDAALSNKKRARPASCFTIIIFVVAFAVLTFFIPFATKFTSDLITAPSSVPILHPSQVTRRSFVLSSNRSTFPVQPNNNQPPASLSAPISVEKTEQHAQPLSAPITPTSSIKSVTEPAAVPVNKPAVVNNSPTTTARQPAQAAEQPQAAPLNPPVTVVDQQSQNAEKPPSAPVSPVNSTNEQSSQSSEQTSAVSKPSTSESSVTVAPKMVVHDEISILVRELKLTNRTLLNYFHMHKTGGVTTKTIMRYVLRASMETNQRKMNGDPIRFLDTCYMSSEKKELIGPARHGVNWRCDFKRIREMPESKLAVTDVVMGHQYWVNGCDKLFGAGHEVRYMSIFRHPLPRKLSFYYHFYVRAAGRREESASREEVIAFVLGKPPVEDGRIRDAGPNYFASRFLSDGGSGFVKHAYPISVDKAAGAIAECTRKLEERYVMVGLQTQPKASQCMLRKLVRAFGRAHGIEEVTESHRLTKSDSRLNSGGYAWTARKLWATLSDEQRRKFKEVERVDLGIYEEVRRKFAADTKRYACEDEVSTREWENDVYA